MHTVGMRRFLLAILSVSCFAIGADSWAEGAWTASVKCSSVAPTQFPSFAATGYGWQTLSQFTVQNLGGIGVYLGTSSSMALGSGTYGNIHTFVNSNGGLFIDTKIPGGGVLAPSLWWCQTAVSGTATLSFNGQLQ